VAPPPFFKPFDLRTVALPPLCRGGTIKRSPAERSMMRRISSVGLLLSLVGAGCQEPTLTSGACEDLSALTSPTLLTATPSRAPVEARFDHQGRLRSLRGDFAAPGANEVEAA